MQAGFGEVIVTPPLGDEMAGYFEKRLAEGVIDDLYSRALVVREGETYAALVVCDVLYVSEADVAAIRNEITLRTGIPGNQVMVAASHTHTGPVTVTRAALTRNEHYIKTWVRLTAGAVEMAFRNMDEVHVGAGEGCLEGVAFNRRYHMRIGRVHTNPGYNNPDIIKVAGPIDPAVTVLRFDDAKGIPMGILVNYACHPDTLGGNYYSADWLGVTVQKLRQLLQPPGRQLGVVVLNGACGDINHIDVQQLWQGHWPGATQRIGISVAAEAARIATTIRTQTQVPVSVSTQMVSLQRLSMPEFLSRTQENMTSPASGSMERNGCKANIRNADIIAAEPQEFIAEVMGLRIGPAVIASCPGELFCELGMAYKKSCSLPYAMVANLAGGADGYIPTKRAFAEGGYEPNSTRLQPGGGEAIAAAMSAVANELSY